MASAISSLGIGSGVLTSDVIDQLKTADKAKFVTPLESKLTLNSQKQDAYKLVSTYMNTLKADISSLSYDTLFDNKTVDVSGAAKVSVSSGANVESFTLDTTQLAQKEVTQFGAVSSKSSAIADTLGTGGTYTITVGKADGTGTQTSYDIPYTATTTLEQFSQAITDVAGSQVSASILETSTGQFNLVLSSQTTGADQALSFSDSGGINAEFQAGGYQEIQPAQDALFKYNGIDVSRSTNNITDLVTGLDITLTTKGDSSTVDITEDNSGVVTQMSSFVDNYNTLITNLNDMTAYNTDSGKKGVFQGESFIKGIGRSITAAITQMKNGDSLVNYGISLNRDGSMSFDSTKLEDKLSSDSTAVKDFFTGSVDSNGDVVNGLFTDLNDTMNNYTGYGKLLNNFETSLTSDATSIQDRITSAQASLDNRYEIMSKRFASYDSVINKVNSSFSSVQMMINSMSKN